MYALVVARPRRAGGAKCACGRAACLAVRHKAAHEPSRRGARGRRLLAATALARVYCIRKAACVCMCVCVCACVDGVRARNHKEDMPTSRCVSPVRSAAATQMVMESPHEQHDRGEQEAAPSLTSRADARTSASTALPDAELCNDDDNFDDCEDDDCGPYDNGSDDDEHFDDGTCGACGAPCGCLSSLLRDACFTGRTDTVDFLLDRGALIDAVGYDTCTPLMLAAQGGHVATTRLLLARGARLDIRSRWGPPLDVARLWGQDAVRDVLFEAEFGPP